MFEQGRFKEAAKILEEAAELYPNSAPVQFSLGVTYSRIAGEYKDEDAVRPWALKSGEAFKKAVDLANRYGGLNDEQLAKARESAELIKRIKERKTPSIPEDPGRRCAECGKKLQSDVSSASRMRSFDPFADAVREVSLVLATPGYVCQDCKAVVCKGCIPLGGSISCPKCGSENMEMV